MADGCTEIVIENVTESIDPVSSALAAIFGLLFGVLLGVAVYYLYARFIKSEPQKLRQKEKQNVKEKLTGNPYADFFITLSTHHNEHTPGVKKRSKLSGKVHPVAISNEYVDEKVQQVVNPPSLLKVVLQRIEKDERSALRLLADEELRELHLMDVEFWVTRIWCVKNIVRLTSNTLAQKGVIKKKDAKLIAGCHENLAVDMDNSLEKLKMFLSGYKASEDGESLLHKCQGKQGSLFEITKELCVSYFLFWNLFKIQLENFVQPEIYDVINQELNQAFILIESSVSTQLESVSAIVKQIYKRMLVVLQTIDVATMSMNAQERYFALKQSTILARLVKTGRISSDTKDDLLQRDNEKYVLTRHKNNRSKEQSKQNKTDDKINFNLEDKVKELNESNFVKISNELGVLQKEQEKTLQYNTADENIKLKDFLGNFLQIRLHQFQKKYDLILQEVTNETNEMVKLLEEDSGNKQEETSKKIDEFCQELLNKDALDETECHGMKDELMKDVTQYQLVAYKNLQGTVHHMWQKLEMNQKQENTKDNVLSMVLLNDMIAENSKNTNYLVDNFPYFPVEKTMQIFQEREIVLTLLGNLINSNRIQWIHVFESDLVECQWRLLKEKQEALAENKIQKTEQVLERLWKERNQMLDYSKDFIVCTSMYNIVQFCGSILSHCIAHEVIKVLRPERMMKLLENNRMKEISTTLEDVVANVDEETQSKISFLTQKYRLECKESLKPVLNNFKSQVQAIVENSKAKETMAETKLKEVSASIHNQPGYDGLILEHDLAMEIDDLEQRSSLLQHKAMIELRKSYDGSINQTLEDVKKAHMCKIASECGLSKKQFIKIVENASVNAYASHEEAEDLAQSFMQFWQTNQKLNSRRRKKTRTSQSFYD